MNDINKIQWKPKPSCYKHSAKNLWKEFNFSELCYLMDGLKKLMEAEDWAFDSYDVQQLYLDILGARMLEKNRARTDRGKAFLPRWQMLLIEGSGEAKTYFFGVSAPGDSDWYDEPDGDAEERMRALMEEGQTLLWVSDRWRGIHDQLMEHQFPHAWDYYAASGRLIEYNNRTRKKEE